MDAPVAREARSHEDNEGTRTPWLAAGLAIGLGLLAAALYTVLRQDTTHEYDIYWMLPKLRDGLTNYPRHPLAFPVLDALVSMLDGWGNLHERFKIANGLSTGAAVGIFTHAAYVLRANLRQAALIGITFALLPVTVRFATLAELHGVFLPFAAMAIWQACRMVKTPTTYQPLAGLVLGLLTAIAAGVHGTGHLLIGVTGLLLAVAWWQGAAWRQGEPRTQRALGMRKLIVTLVTLVATHAIASKLITLGITVPTTAPVNAQWYAIGEDTNTMDGVFATIAGELVWPLLPVSFLWPFALFQKPRTLATVFALSLAAYLVTCQLLLCVPTLGYAFHEHGAYLEPIAFFAVLIAVRLLRGPWALLLPLLALAAAVHWRYNPERASPNRSFGATASSYLGSHDVRLVVGGFAEWDGAFEVLIENPELDSRRSNLMLLEQLILETRVHSSINADQFALYFHPNLAGKPTVLTTKAVADMRAAGGLFADCIDNVMPRLYEFEEVLYAPDGGTILTGIQLKPRL